MGMEQKLSVVKLPDINQNSISIFDSFLKNKNKNNQIFPYCNESSNKKIKYAIEKNTSKSYVNLKNLEQILEILNNNEDRNESHDYFMKNYWKILENDDQKQIKIRNSKMSLHSMNSTNENKNLTQQLSDRTETLEENQDKKLQKAHDIKVYIEKIHHKKLQIEDPEQQKLETLKKLKKLIKKYPFERKAEENKEILKILCTFDDFLDLFPPSIRYNEPLLEELCGYAIMESVLSKNNPVFGHFAFYLILNGSVTPVSVPHLNKNMLKLGNNTPEPSEKMILGPGDCFGTITELEGREISTRMFRVITCEDKCDFLKISFENYNKVKKKIFEQERVEKITAIRSCQAYSSWPNHLIEELMDVFEWQTFSANTILTSEGYHCPFIGFIKSGECHVLRKVDVPYVNKKTGFKEKKMKQVVVGKIKENESFGEISVIMKEPMTCTIVSETPCKIGLIPCDKLNKLEPITMRLLLQTTNRTFSDLPEHTIYQKFIEQEKQKEWKHFKNQVIQNIIQKNGIVHGTGKFKTANISNET